MLNGIDHMGLILLWLVGSTISGCFGAMIAIYICRNEQ